MNDHASSRLHSTVLVSPKRERRRDRKARKLAARDLLARDRAEQKTAARAKADALTAERKATVLLPFTQQVVPTVDLAQGRIVVDPPEGLF